MKNICTNFLKLGLTNKLLLKISSSDDMHIPGQSKLSVDKMFIRCSDDHLRSD